MAQQAAVLSVALTREIEKDYISFTANVLQKQASVDKHVPLCPICCQQIRDPDQARSSSSSATSVRSSSSAEALNACNDCERVVCSACGSFETSMKTKVSGRSLSLPLPNFRCHTTGAPARR